MKKVNINDLVVGSTFFGTGGGGSPIFAHKYLKKLILEGDLPDLKAIEDFPKNSLFVSGFGVGNLAQNDSTKSLIKKCVNELQEYLKQKITGVIPVEIGPLSINDAFELAACIEVPVVDADVVGGRSAPEVFLETITLFNIPRTPSVVANTKGDTALLIETMSYKQEEKFYRDFSKLNNCTAYVLGYPLSKKQIQKTCEQKTVTTAIKIGNLLNQNQMQEALELINGIKLYEGVVTNIKEIDNSGFTEKYIYLEGDTFKAKLYIKNENLVFWLNEEPILTCPDLIILCSSDGKAIYNTDIKLGENISVIGAPARKLWRTEAGLKLFSPKKFGFSFDPVLL